MNDKIHSIGIIELKKLIICTLTYITTLSKKMNNTGIQLDTWTRKIEKQNDNFDNDNRL